MFSLVALSINGYGRDNRTPAVLLLTPILPLQAAPPEGLPIVGPSVGPLTPQAHCAPAVALQTGLRLRLPGETRARQTVSRRGLI